MMNLETLREKLEHPEHPIVYLSEAPDIVHLIQHDPEADIYTCIRYSRFDERWLASVDEVGCG
jgi:hypothetical protein